MGRLEGEFADFERLVGERDLPREVLQAVRHLSRRQEGIGLSETELRERLNRFQDIHILSEHPAPARAELRWPRKDLPRGLSLR